MGRHKNVSSNREAGIINLAIAMCRQCRNGDLGVCWKNECYCCMECETDCNKRCPHSKEISFLTVNRDYKKIEV